MCMHKHLHIDLILTKSISIIFLHHCCLDPTMIVFTVLHVLSCVVQVMASGYVFNVLNKESLYEDPNVLIE